MRCSGLEEEYNLFIQSMENNDNPRGKKILAGYEIQKKAEN